MAQVTANSGTLAQESSSGGFVRLLSHLCFAGGFLSIFASIAVWMLYTPTEPGLGERAAIFIGLWAPTFFALSDRLDRYVTSRAR